MTRYALILALALSAASGAAVAQTTHPATGVVKKIDAAKGTVTLAHEPIKSLKWPAMTMDFTVADKQALTKLKPGQKVEFKVVERAKGQFLISEINPSK
jgi:Cu/Ag efflux protein CusF